MESCKPYGRNPYGRNMNGMNNMNQYGNRPGHMRGNGNCNSCNPVPPSPMNSLSDCGCNENNTKMRNMSLAMGYVPMQSWGELYDPDTAICQGTAFPDLNLIFCGSRGKM